MKRTINFYTESQNQTIIKALQKGTRPLHIARKYAKLWNRPENSLYTKAINLQKKPTSTRALRKGIEFPKGWSFDIANVKRAVLNDNSSITLYF